MEATGKEKIVALSYMLTVFLYTEENLEKPVSAQQTSGTSLESAPPKYRKDTLDSTVNDMLTVDAQWGKNIFTACCITEKLYVLFGHCTYVFLVTVTKDTDHFYTKY